MYQPDLFAMQKTAEPLPVERREAVCDVPSLINRLTEVSARPRYGFMVLSLIARVAGEGGEAGPYVREGERNVPIRDWLSEALMPIAQRDARRRAMAGKVREELRRRRALPADEAGAERAVEAEIQARIRQSGVCNVSRVVSELVNAGLVTRRYKGYRVDHENRGARRHAVYALAPEAHRILTGN